MTILNEGRHTGEFLISEANGRQSREVVTLAEGNTLGPGAVLSRITLGAATAAPAGAGTEGANTGNGTLTLDATTPLLAGAQAGVYTIRAIDVTGSDAGTFRVTDPRGNVLGDVKLPGTAAGTAAFANQIKFVIADGSTDYAITDGFTVTVAAGSGQYTELDPDAKDGSARAAGILWDHVNAAAAAQPAVIIARLAEVRASDLAWPADITNGEKAAAIAALATHNILVR